MKERIDAVVWQTDGPVNKLTIGCDLMLGRYDLLEADPVKTIVSRYYERPSGKPKYLAQSSPLSKDAVLCSESSILMNCECLVSIDTNTRLMNGRRVSVTTAYMTDIPLILDQTEIPFSHLVSYIVVGHSHEVAAEKLGWYLVMKNKLRPKVKGSKKLGIIVDAHLSEIPTINARSQSFYRNYLLPEQFSMIYASDCAADGIVNHMIRYSEKSNVEVFLRNSELLSGLNSDLGARIPEKSGRFLEVQASGTPSANVPKL